VGLQAKLLRVLQEGEIRRVGESQTRKVDVRVLAATARDLEVETRGGRFREDLFYRIHVVAIELPPLRERREDIAPLARLFAARLSTRFARPLSLSDSAVAWLEGQEWPGNVRELENSIERAAVLTNEAILNASDFRREPLPTPHPPNSGEWGVGSGTLREAAERAEREAITAALRAANGNRREAAKALGVSLRTLFYKIDRYEIG
jgi:two-component system response regulator AtoC